MTRLIALTIALSFIISLVLVPFIRLLAQKTGMVDAPDGDRKLHRKSIALGGGIAIFAAVSATFCIVVLFDRYVGDRLLKAITTEWYGLFAAAAAMVAVGLIDDVWSLRGRQKLMLQVLITSAVIGTGTLVEKIGFFGSDVYLGAFAYPITMLWLLVAVNALNLIDGADGMATTAGCIISLGLAFLSIQGVPSPSTIVALSLAGALLAFLIFNKPPASIFLGDAGSMTIGLFVGVLAVWSNVKESTVLASAPVAILAIPLFDSSAAVLRRWLTDRSIYASDRGHLHHLLQSKFGPNGMLLVVASLCLLTTFLAVLSARYDVPSLAAFGVVAALTILIWTRSFGYAEFRLVVVKTLSLAQSFLVAPHKWLGQKQQTRVPLQGTGDWDTIWEPLVDFAKTHDLAQIRIDLSLSWLHEGYHATWTSMQSPEKALQLHVRLPLFTTRAADNAHVGIGRLEIVASADNPIVYQRISDLTGKLTDLSPQIDAIITGLEAQCRFRRQQTDDSSPHLRLICPEPDEPITRAAG